MDEVRELEDGEEAKYYGYYYTIITTIITIKEKNNIICVDREGVIHSFNDKPAYINYQQNNKKDFEVWFNHGKEHRLTGPARITYDGEGNIRKKYYFIDGKYLTQQEFEEYKLLKEI